MLVRIPSPSPEGRGKDHTPFCTPHNLTRQLQESLQRLQTDYVDIYMLHRDNPDVPVGEFIDVLNEHRNAGKIQAFGASNWSIERIEAANHYAETKGLAGFSAISNNFSLARIVEVPWAGCMASSDTGSRDWFTRTQTPLMPWSSQARGFFTRAHADDRSDAEMVRCWYCEENFQRLECARELADRLSVLPVNIALAYVLCQPFPTFPLVGPHTLAETRTSISALDIQLTPEDLRWLDLEYVLRGIREDIDESWVIVKSLGQYFGGRLNLRLGQTYKFTEVNFHQTQRVKA